MKKVVIGLVAVVFAGAIMALGAAWGDGGTASAQEEQETQQPTQAQEEPVTYRYVAQPGDSYTLMMRKAVQTYGKKHDVQLSLAGIIFAETNLTKEAGFPMLHVGQEVAVDERTVQQWVERARNLTAEQQTAWNYYVQFANFNTDNVGEVR